MEIIIESYELDFAIESEVENEIKNYPTDKELTVKKNILQKTKDVLRKLINKIIEYLNVIASKIILKFTSMKSIEAKSSSVEKSETPDSLELKNFIMFEAVDVLFDEIKHLSAGQCNISDTNDSEGKKFDTSSNIVITESQILNAVYYKMVKETGDACKSFNLPYEYGEVKIDSEKNFSNKINPRTADKKFLKNMCASDGTYEEYSSSFIDYTTRSIEKASHYSKDIKKINHNLHNVLKKIENEQKTEVIMNVEVICNATLKLIAILQKALILMLKSSKDIITQYYGSDSNSSNKNNVKLLPSPSNTTESYIDVAMLEIAELNNELMYDILENSLPVNESASDKVIKASRKILDTIILIISKIRAFIKKIFIKIVECISPSFDFKYDSADIDKMFNEVLNGKPVTYYNIYDYIEILKYINRNSINANSCLDISYNIINFQAPTINKKFNQYEFATGIYKSALPGKNIDEFDPYKIAYSLTNSMTIETGSRHFGMKTLHDLVFSDKDSEDIKKYLVELDKKMASLKNDVEKIKKEREDIPLYDIKYSNLLNYISAIYMYLSYSSGALNLIKKNKKMAKEIYDEYMKRKKED